MPAMASPAPCSPVDLAFFSPTMDSIKPTKANRKEKTNPNMQRVLYFEDVLLTGLSSKGSAELFKVLPQFGHVRERSSTFAPHFVQNFIVSPPYRAKPRP